MAMVYIQLLCVFLTSADAFITSGLGSFVILSQNTHPGIPGIVRSNPNNAHRHHRVYMGRFDMEPPYNPPGHRCYETVDLHIRPSLTDFISTEMKDPSIALLFSSISSGIKSISSLTRYINFELITTITTHNIETRILVVIS
jgi:hypothetical protein